MSVMEMPTQQAQVTEINPKTKALLYAVRQALLIVLGAIEDYLGCSRSVTPKHDRRN